MVELTFCVELIPVFTNLQSYQFVVDKEDVLARSTPAQDRGHMFHCISQQVTEKTWAGSTVRFYP